MRSELAPVLGDARRRDPVAGYDGSKDTVQNIFFAAESLPGCRTSIGRDAMSRVATPATERMMKRTLIRYKTKPDMTEKNAELIAGVFEELKAAKPDGVRYLSLRLEDDSFIHFVETESSDGSSVLPKLAAFQAFQSGIRERCAEPPLARGATIVGNYRMLGE
jgi:hypothetical protein